MKKVSIDNIYLHHRRLVTLWQYDYFVAATEQRSKQLDGLYISSNLFSVFIYTTNKEDNVVKAFAQKVAATK